jgi:HNH endonuclease
MKVELEDLVWSRAHSCCEYCQLAQSQSNATFEIDHILAKKHGGKTRASNLALSCFYCNSFKSSNIGGLDKRSGKFTQLFNPRRHSWNRHFRWNGAYLVGRSAIGRTTVDVLMINSEMRVSHRRLLIAAGEFPPE